MSDQGIALSGHFPSETVDALFAAVEVDVVVDPEVSLPEPILVSCSDETIARCLQLCLQFWAEGASREALLGLTRTLLLKGDLSLDERIRYKHLRARYKHLRFALTLYDVRHRPPPLFSVTVGVMGNLQDAFRNGRGRAVTFYGRVLQALLAPPVWAAIRRRLGAVRLEGAAGFTEYRRSEIRRLKERLGREELTGHEFHSVRKIVSRQVSFYDTLRSLDHQEHDYRMSRFLSAINGLMGQRHDEMVEQALSGERDYRTAEELDPEIRQRLETLVARYPL